MADTTTNLHSILPATGPQDVAVGHALITMVEPHTGYEREYNRWYEDEHFFRGAMAEPWMFAGRRWVATRDLKALRLPATGSVVADPLTDGSYLGTYWITPDRLVDHQAWTQAVNRREMAEGKKFMHSDHIFTSFQDKAGTVYRDADVPDEIFSLMDPSAGIVIEVVDAPTAEQRDALERWLIDTDLPGRIVPGSPVTSAMVFRTNPLGGGAAHVVERMARVANGGKRLTILWFLDRDPREVWSLLFSDEVERMESSGFGRLALAAPFIPSQMGTDAYVDQL